MTNSIGIFTEGVNRRNVRVRRIRQIVREVVRGEGGEIGFVNVIFLDDQNLLLLNQKYLNHNTLTDVITFDYCEDFGNISGDVFISYQRVLENAQKFAVPTGFEICRVVIHGVLHLLGYDDKKDDERLAMQRKEDYYLNLLCSDVSKI